MTRRSIRAVSLFLCASAFSACGGNAPDEPAPDTPASQPASGPCHGGVCDGATGGLRFVNSSGESRAVYVDGALVCVLDPDESCVTPVAAGSETRIHVTDLSDNAVCHDPSAAVSQCACLTLEILC